jgi:hypothetical protein
MKFLIVQLTLFLPNSREILIREVSKIRGKDSTTRRQLASVLTEAVNIRRRQKANKVKEQRKRTKAKSHNKSRLQGRKPLKSKKREKKSSNQKASKHSETSFFL